MDIGVDVESTARRSDLNDIAEKHFTPLEVEQLKNPALSFLDFWTLKEAYIKARGVGLSIPLESFSFILPDASPPRIVFHDGCPDSPDGWQFVLHRDEDYRMAVAARAVRPIRIVEREMVPTE